MVAGRQMPPAWRIVVGVGSVLLAATLAALVGPGLLSRLGGPAHKVGDCVQVEASRLEVATCTQTGRAAGEVGAVYEITQVEKGSYACPDGPDQIRFVDAGEDVTYCLRAYRSSWSD